jgi:hypothetical protein
MAKTPSLEAIAANLTVMERVLLFCLASGTDWAKASVTGATVQHLIVRSLVERDRAGRLMLTEQGFDVLLSMIRRAG